MKITIKKRNTIVEQYLWCIDRVIRQNWHLIEAAHLDRDDVYQDLAIRLIRAVAGYDPKWRGMTPKKESWSSTSSPSSATNFSTVRAPRNAMASRTLPTIFAAS